MDDQNYLEVKSEFDLLSSINEAYKRWGFIIDTNFRPPKAYKRDYPDSSNDGNAVEQGKLF